MAKVMMVRVDLFVEWYRKGLPERSEDGLALSTKEKIVGKALLIEALKARNPHKEALDEWYTDHI